MNISTQQSSLVNHTQASFDYERSTASKNGIKSSVNNAKFKLKKSGWGLAMNVSDGETVCSSVGDQKQH